MLSSLIDTAGDRDMSEMCHRQDKRYATLGCVSDLKKRKRKKFFGMSLRGCSSPDLASPDGPLSVPDGVMGAGQTAMRIAVGSQKMPLRAESPSEPSPSKLFSRKSLGHGFSVLYYKRVRLKSFDNIARSLDNNNKVQRNRQSV